MSEKPKSYRRGKATTVDWQVLKSLSNEKTTWLCVSERDKAILTAGLVPLRWVTRYNGIDDDLKLPDMIDKIQAYLDMSEPCCDAIAECIDISAEVKAALDRYLSGSRYGSADSDLTENISALDTCDEDTLFGAVTELVKYINKLVEDEFERIEVATNVAESLANWLGGTVIAAPLSAIVDYVDWLIESVADNYAAQYDTSLEDTYRCDLFCLALDNDCSLTNRQIFDYFTDRLTSVVPLTDLDAYLDFFITGSFPGTQIVDALYASIVGMFVLDEAIDLQLGWFDVTSEYSLSTAMALGALTPDSSWTLLCDPCPQTWCLTFLDGDGQISNATLVAEPGYPFQDNYTSNACTYDAVTDAYIGGQNDVLTAGTRNVVIQVNFASAITVTYVEIEVEFLATRDRGGVEASIALTLTDDTLVDQQTYSGTNAQTQKASFNVTTLNGVTAFKISGWSAQQTPSDAAYFNIVNIRIEGDGTAPAVGGSTC